LLLVAAAACGDDGGGSHYCCTLQTLCSDCSCDACDASERTIAESNDEPAGPEGAPSRTASCEIDTSTCMAAPPPPAAEGEPCETADQCASGLCCDGPSGFCSKDCQTHEDCGTHSGGGANLCFKLGPESSTGSCSPDCTGDCAHLGEGFSCVPPGSLELCLHDGF
jgi:hypothetical protein